MPFYNSAFARKLYCVAVLAFLSGFIPWLHPAAGQDGNASTISLTISPVRQAAVDSANNVWNIPEYGITVRLPAPAPGQPSAGRVQPLAPENPWQLEILRESKSLGFKESVACLIIPDGLGNVTFGAEKGLSISFYWNRANASPEAFYFDPWYRTLVPLAAWSNPGENTLEVVLDRAGA
ncbi:MAG: hypothetical protein QHH02_02915, partial [Syntrophomonadaceae bacterium]|nr:hypothetical protein [Syntrophomonadaceae bacterium]